MVQLLSVISFAESFVTCLQNKAYVYLLTLLLHVPLLRYKELVIRSILALFLLASYLTLTGLTGTDDSLVMRRWGWPFFNL